MQWEYQVYTAYDTPNSDEVYRNLNYFGVGGWELVCILTIQQVHYYHFKRPKPKPTVDLI